MGERMQSRHYFSEKGAVAEAVIHELANNTFFTDWCYPNPKKPNGKELCDLLVVFDDTAIIWQIKDIKANEDGGYDAGEVQKNLRQLGGARRSLFDLKLPIQLSNPRRGAEPFEASLIKHVHLISVLMGDGDHPMPMMPEIKGRRIHSFTREFADIVLSELDTMSDFCRYLRAKESIDKGKRIAIMGGEENLLGKYIEMGRNFNWIANYDTIMVDDTIWPTIATMPQYIEKKKMDAISRGWDSIIDRVHEGSSRYERVARELARPDRYIRRLLSASFYEAYSLFMASDGELFRRQTVILDTAYCFLITDNVDHPSIRNQKMLSQMCFVSRGLNPSVQRVVGIATTKANKGYDFCFMDKPHWTPEDELLKLQLQEHYGIFKSPVITETSDDEYPPPEMNG